MRGRAGWIAVGAAWLVLTGCSGEAVRPASDVEAVYAEAFLAGSEFGLSGWIRAGEWDPSTGLLTDVSIESGEGIYHAEHARIVVDASADTVAVRLIGITGASEGTGRVFEAREHTTEAVRVGYDVVR